MLTGKGEANCAQTRCEIIMSTEWTARWVKTFQLHSRANFKEALCYIISPLDVTVLQCEDTETNLIKWSINWNRSAHSLASQALNIHCANWGCNGHNGHYTIHVIAWSELSVTMAPHRPTHSGTVTTLSCHQCNLLYTENHLHHT